MQIIVSLDGFATVWLEISTAAFPAVAPAFCLAGGLVWAFSAGCGCAVAGMGFGSFEEVGGYIVPYWI